MKFAQRLRRQSGQVSNGHYMMPENMTGIIICSNIGVFCWPLAIYKPISYHLRTAYTSDESVCF